MKLNIKDFSPYVQYLFDKDKNIVGAEVLMRPPFRINTEKVIKVLTNNDSIYLLDSLAFRYALKFQKGKNYIVSSNFSGKTLARKDVTNLVLRDGQNIKTKIEITEYDGLSKLALENIDKLFLSGFPISLDDYGSGYNSLNRIQKINLSEIKLDRFLVQSLPSKKATAGISAVVAMGHLIGCDVIAEGVESEKQFNWLVKLGCDKFQGYWLHKPELMQLKQSSV